MDLFEAIAKRHSYRGNFTDAPVPIDDLITIVQAGIKAPSGKNEQSTTFVIVNDPPVLEEMCNIIDKPFCKTAKAMIVCISDPTPVFMKLSFAAEDRAAAVENMLLAITALGYATVWLDGLLYSEDRAQRISKLLRVPENLEVKIVLPIGVPVERQPQKEKQSFDKRAWFNKYGG